LTAEEDYGELGFAVLESEVDVAGGSGAAVGDLAFDPEIGEGSFDLLADVGDEGADGPDAALGDCGGREWFGFSRGTAGGGFGCRIYGRGDRCVGEEEAGLGGSTRRGLALSGTELCLAGAEACQSRRVVFPLGHTA
jgi:hypothetical protein